MIAGELGIRYYIVADMLRHAPLLKKGRAAGHRRYGPGGKARGKWIAACAGRK